MQARLQKKNFCNIFVFLNQKQNLTFVVFCNDAVKQVIFLIISRLDYDNALLFGCPTNVFSKQSKPKNIKDTYLHTPPHNHTLLLFYMTYTASLCALVMCMATK